MTIKITTIEDVKAFANHLANDLHLNFHPDDDFSFYVNYETKEPTFSPEEAAKYNALMNECFDVCERANVDVYDIMGEYLQKNSNCLDIKHPCKFFGLQGNFVTYQKCLQLE